MTLPRLTTFPRHELGGIQQAARKRLEAARDWQDAARHLFEAQASNETHDTVLLAEDEVLFAEAILGEWEI